MKVCPKCGVQLNDDAGFCSNCGYSFVQQNQQAQQNQQFQNQQFQNPQYQQNPYYQPVTPPTDHTAEFTAEDVSENRIFALLAYLNGLVGIVIALLVRKDSKYLEFHVRQAVRLTVATAVCVLVSIIPIIGWLVMGIGMIILTVLKLICFFNTAAGKSKEVPLVSSIGFLK